VLGGGEVTLLNMTTAYSVLANEGEKVQTRSILRIEDPVGNIIEEVDEEIETERVIDREAALQISNVLSDNVARTPLYGANSQLYFGEGVDVAAKTGTTNDKRDAWIFGYTPNIVVGAWAGNNNNESMNEISGLIISPLWRAFMNVALESENIAEESFPDPAAIPDDIKPVLRSNGYFVDASSLVGDLGNNPDTANIIEALYSNTHSILHFVNKDDPRGPYPSNPASDPQYNLWEYGVTAWKNNQFFSILNQQAESENNQNAEEGIEIGDLQN